EIVGPDGGGVAAAVQIDLDMHLLPTQIDEFASVADGAVSADLPAVESDVDWSWLEAGGRGSNRRQHSSPVGVLAEDSALEEVASRDRTTDLHRILLRRRVAHL